MTLQNKTILVVDDEQDIRALVGGILEDEGYAVCEADTYHSTIEQLESNEVDLVLLDIWLENSAKDGIGILEDISESNPETPVIMMSGHGNIELAVKALQIGAFDFIEKPFKTERLLVLADRALEIGSLRQENKALKQNTQKETRSIVGLSKAAEELKKLIDRVSPTNSRVLLSGEAGVGKDFIGRLIHDNSERSEMPFMAINCGSLQRDKADLELLGCLEGVQGEPERTGILERCNGGTLFLDEVGDMPYETQGSLVRILQEQRFEKLGSTKTINLDLRVIASTSYNLEEKIANGSFRQDFYYRLNVVSINVPSLRERREDIELLCNAFASELAKRDGNTSFTFSASAMSALQSYDWPGNMRQLRNIIEWLTIMKISNEKRQVEPEDLPPEISGSLPQAIVSEGPSLDFLEMNLKDARASFERDYLHAQIQRFNGNITKAAEAIGMERSALHRKIKTLETQKKTNPNDLDSAHEIGDNTTNETVRKIG